MKSFKKYLADIRQVREEANYRALLLNDIRGYKTIQKEANVSLTKYDEFVNKKTESSDNLTPTESKILEYILYSTAYSTLILNRVSIEAIRDNLDSLATTKLQAIQKKVIATQYFTNVIITKLKILREAFLGNLTSSEAGKQQLKNELEFIIKKEGVQNKNFTNDDYVEINNKIVEQIFDESYISIAPPKNLNYTFTK